MQTIKEARKALGMTQEQLAKALGVTQGAVAQWENGISHPAYEKLSLIASVLKMSIDELIKKAG